MVKDAFNPAEIESAVEGIHNLIENKYSDFRGVQIEPKLIKQVDDLTPSQYRNSVRKVYNCLDYEPLLNEIFYAPKLLQIVAQMIDAAPVHLLEMALLIASGFGTDYPWHLDGSYFNFSLDETVVGVWIALDDTTVENGCMHVLDQGHKEGPQNHFLRRDWQICDTDVERLHHSRLKVAAIPLPAGGCMLFSGLLPHGSPPNQTAKRRRALQFQYYPASTEQTTDENRMAIYGGEGKGIEC